MSPAKKSKRKAARGAGRHAPNKKAARRKSAARGPAAKKSGGRGRSGSQWPWGRWALQIAAIGALAAIVLSAVPVLLLRWVPPPTTAFMLISRHADPATGRACAAVDYRWVPWSAISLQVPLAILVAEDQRFLMHRGFDTKAIGHAVDDFVAGGRMRGASTVTQQVAKNLFLWPGRSVLRKSLEAWFTVWIELLWPKRRIAEVHVNIAQFGPCVFGVEAASRRFFGIHASQITAAKAARLAAVLPAPGRMRVDEPGPFATERADEILKMLRVDGGPSYLRGL